MFIKQSSTERKTILILYVDDIILTGDYEEETLELKKFLAKEFEIKDLGNLKYFLGMEVARSKRGILVSQWKYVLDLLKETGMLGCKPVDAPMNLAIKLRARDDSVPMDKGRYQKLVKKLIYLSHTRPDISFPISVQSLELWHMAYVKEYGRVLQELSIPVIEPMRMHCDNQSVISIAKNPIHHDRTKHVEIDRHFVKEKIESRIISLLYTSTCQQIANILTLTKAVLRKSFEQLNSKLGLINIYSLEGECEILV
ncbi:Retrovirus-related Pol polyprotein from transposon TNT 1-94 [Melia azedarach]|uniref:Retrovirus-related Pol polyprotein from transposon TNT 1-94 n=1 Tax=Melia azedarach TaxID=155640 RepID=A0ACC1WQ28_MELAZ|nr:Retrovirus-related Pol polyprotein from transposon TNT 1-94 [Melia azedarach]